MSDSIWNDPRITAYVLGELPVDEQAPFEAELESNPKLAAAVEEARNVTGQLEGLFASEATATLDENARQAIVAARDEAVPPIQASQAGWKIPVLVLAMAATLLLMLGLAPWLKHDIDITAAQLSQDEIAEAESKITSVEEEEAEDSGVESMAIADGTIVTNADSASDVALSISPPNQVEALHYGVKADSLDLPLPDMPALKLEQNAIANRSRNLTRKSLQTETQQVDSYTGSQPKDLTELNEVVKAKESLEGMQDVEVEFIPESGPVVIKGKMSDVGKTPRLIELQESAEAEINGVPREEAVTGGTRAKGLEKQMSESLFGAGEAPRGIQPQSPPAHRFEFQLQQDFSRSKPASDLSTANFRSGAPQPKLSKSPLGSRRGSLGRSASKDEEIRFRGDKFGRAPDFGAALAEGIGPGKAGDKFDPITDNPFKRVADEVLSTLSVDVDTASYSKTRDILMRANQLPRPDVVRIEEMLNYFDYAYEPPANDAKDPFAAQVSVTSCPWNDQHRLARIALKGKTMSKEERPKCNLVFLLDTSGSMNATNKLPLVIEGMQMLVKQLDKNDKVAITVYAGSAGLVLDSVNVKKGKKIRKALTELKAGGSTNGGSGIALAYATARDNFISDGVNRVILCTDGDFNVGTTSTDALVKMVEQEAKGGVFLSVLGFGMGNHNDAMLEQISGKGNGNYAFIDTRNEARKVLVDQTSATLVTIAKDVKLQVEFNPKQVSAYRLIGYENRVLAKEDFKDDKVDAGEIGAGHSVTALYEIVPVGVEVDAIAPEVDDLKYSTPAKPSEAADSGELMTLKLRYKEPDGNESKPYEIPVTDEGGKFEDADEDVRFAAAVAGFGMQLRRSKYAGRWTLSDVVKTAESAKGEDPFGLRAEFVEIARKASTLMGVE
ncbi:MAG: von Willebrand factor type A domain-containing protein [Rubripirellula sp.]